MEVIFSNILTIFIIIGVGFFANKTGLLPEKANEYLSPLLMLITSPCMIFHNIIQMELKEGMLTEILVMIVSAALFFIVFCIIGWFVCTKVLKLGEDRNCGVYIMLFTTINNGFMGFPITLAVFGEEKLFFLVFAQMVLLILMLGPGIAVMNYGEKKHSDLKSLLKNSFGPNTYAAFLGLAVMITGLKIPEFIGKPIELLGDVTTPLAMIVIGVQLGTGNFREILRKKDLMAMSLIKMISVPLITFFAVNWLPIPDVIKVVLIFSAAFPSAVIVSPIAVTEGKDGQLAAEGVAITTLMSMVTIPAMAVILSTIYM